MCCILSSIMHFLSLEKMDNNDDDNEIMMIPVNNENQPTVIEIETTKIGLKHQNKITKTIHHSFNFYPFILNH